MQVSTASTFIHQHYNELQLKSSRLAVRVIFFSKDPGVEQAVWQYHHADFDRASHLLSQLDLDNLFCDADIDTCWDRWKTSFLDIMDSCIPKSTLPDKRSVPWLTKEVVQAIRKRDYYFKKAKRTGDISARDRYNQLRNSIVSQLRQLKKDFFRKFENGF